MSYLERIAERVDSFYVDLAAESLYHPEREANPARARWRFLQRRLKDGSFFLFTKQMTSLSLDSRQSSPVPRAFESKKSKRQSVSFDHVLSQAISSVSKTSASGTARPTSRGHKHTKTASNHTHANAGYRNGTPPPVPPMPSIHQPQPVRPLRLADAHTARARGPSDSTTYEEEMLSKAANRMSQFMNRRMKDIRRLSKSTDLGLSLDHAMAVYGGRRGPESVAESDESEGSSPTSGSSVGLGLSRSVRNQQVPVEQRTMYGNGGASSGPHSRQTSLGSSVRRVPSRSDLHSATFSRKLSVYGNSRPGTPSGQSQTGSTIPAVPPKPSHW